MKIKNIAFSGFAAMIFAGLCGAADAVSYNLASKSYVDEQLESKANLIDLTELQDTVGKKATQEDLINVATQVNQNTIDIATLMGREHLTADDLTLLRNELQAKINALHESGDYATAASLQAVSESLATLEGNVYTKDEVDEQIAKVTTGGDINLEGYAKTSELDALELLVNDNTSEISELKAAGYQTAGDVSTAISTATSGLVTSEALDAKGFLDAASITTGTENGTIAVNGTDVPVQGLGSAAYTESSDYLVGPTPKIGTNFLQAVCTNSACTYKFKAYKDIIEEIKADAGIGEI